MKQIYAEFLGTTILVFLGNSVVANVLLSKTKCSNKNNDTSIGWLTISFGWALAVFMGVLVAYPYSGAHLNPCVTISYAMIGKIPWNIVPFYITSQFLGSMLGSIMVWLLYKDYFHETDSKQIKLSIFSTSPSIKNKLHNFFSEVLSTFTFIFISLYVTIEGVIHFQEIEYTIGLGTLGALPSSLIILGVILSLGGSTGPAINPARDLGPRIIHSILPIHGKGSSDWDYSWIPVLGPLTGSILATSLYIFLLN